MQVAAQETAHGPTPDRMSAIASHIIGQRRYITSGEIACHVCCFPYKCLACYCMSGTSAGPDSL